MKLKDVVKIGRTRIAFCKRILFGYAPPGDPGSPLATTPFVYALDLRASGEKVG